MAIAFVTSHGSSEDNDNDTALVKATTGIIPVGNLVIVMTSSEDNAPSSVTDASSNTYASAREQQAAAGTPLWAEIFYTVVTTQISSGANIQVNWGANSRPKNMLVWEFSGPHATPLDVVTSNSGTGTTQATGTTATTAQADEVAIAFWCNDLNPTYTGDATYTGNTEFGGSFGGGSSTPTGFAQYKILSGTGTQQATCTRTGGASAWAGCIATFKASGAAAAASLIWQPAAPSLYKR